jgi:REP element-mobilizing transposase RayT
MILAFHVIFGTYGFWLPNDPRGSWSDFVASWDLFRFGPATKVDTTRSVAAIPHDQARRLAAKEALTFPPVQFTGQQALTVANGFKQAVAESGYRIHACAILPEHVHLVIGWHARQITRILGHLKAKATHALHTDGPWPSDTRPVWAEGSWKVYLTDRESVRRAIAYVENNPSREAKPRQHWSFVAPFTDGSLEPACEHALHR